MRSSLLIFAAACWAHVAAAEPIEFRYGVDVFSDRDTSLDALQSIAAMTEVSKDLHFGPALYSAAAGDAGGLFIGGFELLKRVAINSQTSLTFGGFIGGGGGAGVIPGDGLMTKVYLGIERQFGSRFIASLGASYIDISGSRVSSPALSFSLTRNVDFAYNIGGSQEPPSSGRVLRAIKPLVKQFRVGNSLRRDGTRLQDMTLVGAEASFAANPNATNETFIQMSGAVAGDGEGYADVQFGYRWLTRPDGFRAYADVAAGFGGGGNVDTGGGLIASIGAGVAVPLFAGVEAELGAQAIRSLEGDFSAVVPYLRTSFRFGEKSKTDYADIRNWQLSMGLTYQDPNSAFRKPGVTATAAPVLIETSLDLFLNERTYAIFNAQTVAAGDAGGYAIGLLGLGYSVTLSQRWSLAGEGYIGAAGGGGVDTGGGLVGGGRVEVDYLLNDHVAVSAGVGKLTSLRNGGARPTTIHLGLKTRFNTFH